ncbi:MAG: hypothetical protein R3233_04825 [Xanthomonadales bacterium]|nr:hypothetical protein [Xanthomonadales bacterium]
MNTSTILARQRGISSRSTFLLLLALGLVGAGFWFFYPNGPPTAARLVAPADGAAVGIAPVGTPLTLHWEQGGARTLDGRQPRTASHFIVCVRDPARQDCDGSGNRAPLVREEHASSALNRQPVGPRTGGIFDARDARWAYTHTVTLPNSTPTRDHEWTVAACSGPGGQDCTWTQPGHALAVHDDNLVAVNIDDNNRFDDNTMTSQLAIDIDIENTGSRALGPFEVRTNLYEIRADGSNDPITNPADPAVNAAQDTVITTELNAKPVPQAIADGDAVYAILVGGGTTVQWSATVSSIPAGTTMKVKPCTLPVCAIAAPSGAPVGQTTVFMGQAWVDFSDQVAESDETDNRRVENKLRLIVLQ